MVNKQKDKEIMNYKMSTHNVYYDKLVEARELRNKRCISILSYWSLRRKLVKKYKKEVMEESDRRD
ncbi:hypothetical protein FFIC_282440 [Fructobacillus ficulneus]|uniref:Uncharacterized protein n=2 Tax=Fructobacillus ficulneus TaxID=157463 RepID=A0A0K8MI46_9LACO|nr:hypothetical protein FFIC_282440 [Fructobacillus ficulneus]